MLNTLLNNSKMCLFSPNCGTLSNTLRGQSPIPVGCDDATPKGNETPRGRNSQHEATPKNAGGKREHEATPKEGERRKEGGKGGRGKGDRGRVLFDGLNPTRKDLFSYLPNNYIYYFYLRLPTHVVFVESSHAGATGDVSLSVLLLGSI